MRPSLAEVEATRDYANVDPAELRCDQGGWSLTGAVQYPSVANDARVLRYTRPLKGPCHRRYIGDSANHDLGKSPPEARETGFSSPAAVGLWTRYDQRSALPCDDGRVASAVAADPRLIPGRARMQGDLPHLLVGVMHPCCHVARHVLPTDRRTVAARGDTTHRWQKAFRRLTLMSPPCDPRRCVGDGRHPAGYRTTSGVSALRYAMLETRYGIAQLARSRGEVAASDRRDPRPAPRGLPHHVRRHRAGCRRCYLVPADRIDKP